MHSGKIYKGLKLKRIESMKTRTNFGPTHIETKY